MAGGIVQPPLMAQQVAAHGFYHLVLAGGHFHGIGMQGTGASTSNTPSSFSGSIRALSCSTRSKHGNGLARLFQPRLFLLDFLGVLDAGNHKEYNQAPAKRAQNGPLTGGRFVLLGFLQNLFGNI